jgi:L-iditol 2-dehydrogenase
MKAAIIEKPGKVTIREVRRPGLRYGEVLIKVRVTGICGAEIHAYHGTHPYRIPPVLSGHELAGDIEAIGEGIQKFRVGDRVTVEPQIACKRCQYCLSGHYNLCTNKIVLGTKEWPGSLGEYITAPEEVAYKLPNHVLYEAGAFVEPLSVGVHAVRVAHLAKDDNVLIAGSGSIGLSVLGAVKNYSEGQIICSDIKNFNLGLARRLGAYEALSASGSDFLEAMNQLTGGKGVDIAFVTVGSANAFEQSLQATRKRGKTIIIGLFTEKTHIDLSYILSNEKTVMGSLMYRREDFEESLNLIASGKFSPGEIITHRLPIECAQEAFDLVDKKSENVVKVMLTF